MTPSTRKLELTEGLIIDRDINITAKYFRQHTGVWYPQLSWLSTLKDTQVYFDQRMSKFV